MSNDNIKLPHRDDLPYTIAEEIVEELKKRYPGRQIVFAGDDSDQDAAMEALTELEQRQAALLKERRCVDCGKRYPVDDEPWPPEALADGWSVLWSYTDGSVKALVCDTCSNDDDGSFHIEEQEE